MTKTLTMLKWHDDGFGDDVTVTMTVLSITKVTFTLTAHDFVDCTYVTMTVIMLKW